MRNVFSAADVATMRERFDAWRVEMLVKHASTFVCGNHRVWMGSAGEAGGSDPSQRVLRGVQVRHAARCTAAPEASTLTGCPYPLQWPSYSDPVLDAYRTDPRMFTIVSALLGDDIKQIINQM